MRWLALLLALLQGTPADAQQFSNACRVACRVSQADPSPEQRQCLIQCMAGQPITREAAGQARASGAQAVNLGAPAPPPASRRGAAAATLPNTSQNTGQSRPNAVHYGAVYLATPPNMGYGMATGQQDRNTAHRVAERACRASGANCVMAEDVREPCVAIAEGVRRAPGALFMTSDPKTYIIRAINFRSAGNRADAERDALELCRQRERGALTCRIVQSQCAAR